MFIKIDKRDKRNINILIFNRLTTVKKLISVIIVCYNLF